ncbi:MAG: DMT family transporter [Flavobacteriales bacterium]|nr:DMT family transporter [Flavobacteriales bacterium]
MGKAYIQLHVAIFLWGFTGIFGRLITLEEYPLVWWRILLTVLALGGILKWKDQLNPPSRKELKKMAVVGGLIAFHWVTFFGAIKYANVSVALCALASTSLFTAILDPLINKRRPIWSELTLGAITILGIYLIFHFQKFYTTGIILGLVSAITCAYFTIRNKELLSNHGPSNLLFYELLSGLGALTLFYPLYLFIFPTPTLLPSLADSGYLILLSFVCTVYAMQLSYKALQKVSPFVMNLSVNLEPVYSIILAAFIFQENKELNLGFYLGASIIILSVAANGALHTRKRRKRKSLQEDMSGTK